MGSFSAFAQGQRLEGIRIAFITQDLGLSTSQAERFWPTFNEFSAKRKVLHANLKLNQQRVLSETASDGEVNASIDEIMTLRRQELDLVQQYLPLFRKVLNPKQVGRLVTIEKRMARQFIQRQRRGAVDAEGD